MDRREFVQSSAALMLAGCGSGADEMPQEFTLQPSPLMRSSKSSFGFGVQGEWTPGLTFASPGDLSVTYGLQLGRYTRFGPMVWVAAIVQTSSFTHTTASGALRITGLPLGVINDAAPFTGAIDYRGLTFAPLSQVIVKATGNNNYCTLRACGSGASSETVDNTHAVSGTAKDFRFSLWYLTSEVS